MHTNAGDMRISFELLLGKSFSYQRIYDIHPGTYRFNKKWSQEEQGWNKITWRCVDQHIQAHDIYRIASTDHEVNIPYTDIST
jgi:hypothetical protein